MKKIIICGPGRAGKDEAGLYLEKITRLKFAGTTSLYLAKYVAQRLGISEQEAYSRRRESDAMRMTWFDIGNEIRDGDPTLLVRESIAAGGDILGGLRNPSEIRGAIYEGLCDLSVWIKNDRVPTDPTMQFGSEECDVVIENNGSLDDYHIKLIRLARFAGLLA